MRGLHEIIRRIIAAAPRPYDAPALAEKIELVVAGILAKEEKPTPPPALIVSQFEVEQDRDFKKLTSQNVRDELVYVKAPRFHKATVWVPAQGEDGFAVLHRGPSPHLTAAIRCSVFGCSRLSGKSYAVLVRLPHVNTFPYAVRLLEATGCTVYVRR